MILADIVHLAISCLGAPQAGNVSLPLDPHVLLHLHTLKKPFAVAYAK